MSPTPPPTFFERFGKYIGAAALLLLVYAAFKTLPDLVTSETPTPGVPSRMEGALESQELLTNRLGMAEEYVPSRSGAVSAERLAIFVDVSMKMEEKRAALEYQLRRGYSVEQYVVDAKTDVAMRRVIHGAVLQPLGKYLSARNRALLKAEMSLGEYLYIYSLAHYSRSGKSPDEVPEIFQGRGRRDRRIYIENHPLSAPDVGRRYHRFALSVARNQLASMDPYGEGYKELAREIGKLEGNPQRVLWADRLPWDIETVLARYAKILGRTYHPKTSFIEFPLREEEWRDYWSPRDFEPESVAEKPERRAASRPRPEPRARPFSGTGLDSERIRDIVDKAPSKREDRLDQACREEEFVSAVRADYVKKVYACLRQGSDPDVETSDRSHTALTLAMTFKDTAMFEVLLAGGADPNYKAPRALTAAITRNAPLFLEALLDNGADPNAGPIEEAPLVTACKRRRYKMARKLLDLGADPNGGSFREGYAVAWSIGDLELFQALLDAGADPSLRTRGGSAISKIRNYRARDKGEYLDALAAAGYSVE